MTQPTTRTIKAHELLPGDLVVNEQGERIYAAFDVEHRDDRTRVWTAVRDQDAGQPRDLELNRDDDVLIQRTTAEQRTANRTTPAFIGGGHVVHLLVGNWSQETARGAGIELDSLCGARHRIGSRSSFLPGVTIKADVSVTCRRCETAAARDHRA